MDAERVRLYLLTLPHAVETMQWGDNLVFWVGDKAIGGKMFALVNLESGGKNPLISYAAGPERFPELVEIEGIIVAPYFARIFWVAVQRWDVFRDAEWKQQLKAAYEFTLAKLPPKTTKVVALPASQRKRIVTERRKLLAEKDRSPARKTPPPPPSRSRPAPG
jgi:predicted DNA-binding protein (MmcQ/YjbR family)